jgi:hypothetical protein
MARCVCRNSSKFPICDGSHVQNGWSCAINNQTSVEACFLTSSNYYPLVEGLSSKHFYPATHKSKTNLKVDICYVISDGIDWDEICTQIRRVEAEHWVVFSIYRDSTILISALNNQIPEVSCEGRNILDPDFMFTEISTQLHKSSNTIDTSALPTKVFLSHAVGDEDVLHRTIQKLKSFPVQFFICSSSITVGNNWYEEIVTSLEASDLFLFIHTPNSHRSTFCAFECGIARTLEKKIRILSLSSPPLPAYLQHIQAVDITRLKTEQPWLTNDECLNEGFFRCIFS